MTEYDDAAFDAFEAAGWTTKDASAYDSLAGRVTSQVAEPLLEAVGAGPWTKLLDVATGPGYVAARAAERGAETIGLDFSDSMLAYARAHVPGVEFVQGDATALPFENESFDAVTAAFVLLHLGAPERAVAEAARVLRPDGRAAFTVWDAPGRDRWIGAFFEAFVAAGAHPPEEVPPGPNFFEFADDEAFAALLQRSGLDDVEVRTVEFGLRLDDGNELWDGLIRGSVRVGPMVLGQPEELQQAIRRHYDELLEAYRVEAAYEVPVSVKLAVGTKA
ncbi:MAG TPA: methyltransferase domain-containing protein [Gaiellaceae bacterium]|nr:methyltransferase domain-containing protein [Gaiellaceae bacterium]